MATALDTNTRLQITVSAQETFALIACPLCSLHFDEAARTPRSLHCGHTYCSACVQARVEPKSARKWSAACAECARETPVDKGDASTLGKNHNTAALVAQMKAADFMPFRIHVKTMGGELLPLVVVRDELVSRAKQRIAAQRPEFKVAWQRLAVMLADGEHEMLLDSRSIGSYCASESLVALMMADGFGGAKFVRPIGCKGSSSVELAAPRGVCCSPDGEYLFVSDSRLACIEVFRTSDGSHVRTIGRTGSSAGYLMLPHGICLSPDGQSLLVADSCNDRVQVLRASDGSNVRTIGSRGSALGQLTLPFSLCLSSDGELLLVVDSGNNRIQVFNISDGAFVRCIGSEGNGQDQLKFPHDVCSSPDGELCFVADTFNHRVQVFRILDGTHERSIGSASSGKSQLSRPVGVCLSANGQWLFVVNAGNHRVQVFRALDGEHMHTIGCEGSGDGQFSEPHGLCVSPNGEHLFVTDEYTKVARGTVHLFAFSY